MHACVWTRDARDRHRHGLDPAEVLAGTVEIEQPLGYRHLAGTCGLELEQGERVETGERHVLGELVLAPVLLEERQLEALQVEAQRLAGEQPSAPAVPIAELDELLVVELGAHDLVLERLLGPPGEIESDLVAVVVELRELPLHPGVQLFVGELLAQEGVDGLSVLDLALMVVVLVLDYLLAQQRRDDLAPVLLKLARS